MNLVTPLYRVDFKSTIFLQPLLKSEQSFIFSSIDVSNSGESNSHSNNVVSTANIYHIFAINLQLFTTFIEQFATKHFSRN